MESKILRDVARCDTPEREYWMHVSPQEELPLAGTVEVQGHLDRVDVLLKSVPDSDDDEAMAGGIVAALLKDPELLDEARLLVSIKDKRAYLDLSYVFSRTADPNDPGRSLCGCRPDELGSHQLGVFKNIIRQSGTQPDRARTAAATIAAYLVRDKGLGAMLRIYRDLSQAQRAALMTHLVVPGEMQQREAKRRGHGAEAALAQLIVKLGVAMVPADKATNPMGSHDPNVDLISCSIVDRTAGLTASFDLVVLDSAGLVKVCIQALVQSSDPGQFGVEKAKDTAVVRAGIDIFNANPAQTRTVELWSLIDGVGYAENKNGTLNPTLAQVHRFVQIKSLYKAGVALHALGLVSLDYVRFRADVYSTSSAQDMVTRHLPAGLPYDLGTEAPAGGIEAGWAWLVPTPA